MSSKTPSRFQDIRFTVVEIEDPDAPILRILNVHDPLLEPDGSLNVSQILWLRKGDIYMGYTKTEGVYVVLLTVVFHTHSTILGTETWGEL
ncbi:hypothetical protein H2248_001549 [Termitomyces sp. 'cryptogamus']|nr:hypothetical protein H2248_001549 [Termitomyces sp. 'cryptogamus']